LADASNITVALERAIHNALVDDIQRIYELHGIRVSSLSVHWLDCSTIEKESFRVSGTKVVSLSGRSV